MTLVRLYLLLVGAVTVLLGVAYLIWPAQLSAYSAIVLPAPVAVIEIQAFYGGQLLALGVVILFGLRWRRFVLPALLFAAVPIAGVAVGRLYGILTTGLLPPITAGFLALEIATAVVGGVFLRYELGPGLGADREGR